jgi:hypothetical protein
LYRQRTKGFSQLYPGLFPSSGALTFSSVHPTVYSTGKARYPFVAHAEDHMAEQALME